jgi:dipeptidyl aminopeptidase/acylaminoacyl peptidase
LYDVEALEAAPGTEAVEAGTGFDWLAADGDTLCWLEADAATGRAIVVWSRLRSGEAGAIGLRDGSVGSSLHAYGGRPYLLGRSGDLVAVHAQTSQVVGRAARTADGYLYGDLVWSGGDVLCVREREAGDELVALSTESFAPRVLLATDGFLATPRPARDRLAWTQWGRDVMPWDSSEIWVADVAATGELSTPRRVAGGPHESAVQPCWAPDGSLYFVSDRSGWWNLYRWRDGLRGGDVGAVAPMAAECATAPWESSYANYVLLPGGRIAMTAQAGPRQHLIVIEPSGAQRTVRLPYTWIKPYLAVVGDRVGLIGASATSDPEVAVVSTDGSDVVDVVRRPAPRSAARPAPVRISEPEVLTVAGDDATTTVLFYPPTAGADAQPPPLIVRPHEGPTYNDELRLDSEVQFFTSRGYAVAEVDYRGSTGYGRRFRTALDGNWGRFDVQDCCTAAGWLAGTGRVDPQAMFISGASAGGYTALHAACGDSPFSLAVARSAIVDAHRWQTTAPRFQRPHAVILASDSPRVSAAQVTRPVLLVHGVDDRVAPVSDVDEIAVALRERGLLVDLLRFNGVGHYLSAAAQEVALAAELAAYQQVLHRLGRVTAPG